MSNFLMKTAIVFPALLWLFLLVPHQALAESKPEKKDWKVSVQGHGAARAGFENDKGEVSVVGAESSASYKYFTLKYALQSFSWGDKDHLPFGNGRDDPWDELHAVGLDANYLGTVNKNWGYLVGAGIASMFEEETDGSMGGNVRGGLRYTFSKNWRVSLGAVLSHHKIKTQVRPLAGMDWNRGAETGLSVSIGVPRTEVRYRHSARLAVRTALSMDSGMYRLANDSMVQEKGYVETNGFVAGLYLDAEPFENFTLTLGPQYLFGRGFTIYDKHGDKKNAYDVDGALGGVLRLEYKF